MPLIQVEHTDDLRLAVYAGVSDARLREWPDAPCGLFMAESQKVIDCALDAGLRARSLFVEERWLEAARPAVERLLAVDPEAPVLVATEERFRAVTGYDITRGALAAFERPKLPQVEELLTGAVDTGHGAGCGDACAVGVVGGGHGGARGDAGAAPCASLLGRAAADLRVANTPKQRVAVLEDVGNYRNIGAAFRAAAAFGVDAVLVTPSCHDPLYRRAARESKGAVLQVPWTRIGGERAWAREGIPLLHAAGFKVAALALSDDSLPLDDVRLAAEQRLALVLGTEGEGLAAETIALCDYVVRIPMTHGVDSLNVAAASAVAFWQLRPRGPCCLSGPPVRSPRHLRPSRSPV